MLLSAYLIGCISSAQLLAKTFRNLNIYRVGTGHPDTENIYNSVSKSLGILTGLIDIGKIYIVLWFSKLILELPYFGWGDKTIFNLLLLVGFTSILGHCFPITQKFIGGRGMFSYIGFILFFAPIPMLIISIIAAFIVIKYHQIRFAKFMIILLPPILNLIPIMNKTNYSTKFIWEMFLAAVIIGLLNFLVSKRKGEF